MLLGGAVTILPMFADDIFHAGPSGLGWLRNAMAVGAVICAFIIAHRPPLQKAGRAMLWCRGHFRRGDHSVWPRQRKLFWPLGHAAECSLVLDCVCDARAGGRVDNISVVVRQTLVQILTPDEKRGRVSAVNSLFIGTSNELGGFRSGIVAFLFTTPTVLGNAHATGAIISTVTGGIGTILVVLAVAWLWPEIRRFGKLA